MRTLSIRRRASNDALLSTARRGWRAKGAEIHRISDGTSPTATPMTGIVAGELCFSEYRLCGMQVSTARTPAHEASLSCQCTATARRQYVLATESLIALEQDLTVYGEPLESVGTPNYFGLGVLFDDNETPVVCDSIKRVRGV